MGKNVKRPIEAGDRVGVGAQSWSCTRPDCEDCSSGNENLCPKFVQSYATFYPDGSKVQGGYGLYSRVPGHFVFKIPDGVESAHAAPMMCGGITVYNPLRNNGCGPDERVGIVGIGGLGHFGVLFAKALGAKEVVGISRKNAKRDDVVKL